MEATTSSGGIDASGEGAEKEGPHSGNSAGVAPGAVLASNGGRERFFMVRRFLGCHLSGRNDSTGSRLALDENGEFFPRGPVCLAREVRSKLGKARPSKSGA